MAERTVNLVQERNFTPPRAVEIELDGRWLPALQHSWRRWEDDRGWVADVEYTIVHPWGIRTRVTVLPADRLRPGEHSGDEAALVPAGATVGFFATAEHSRIAC